MVSIPAEMFQQKLRRQKKEFTSIGTLFSFFFVIR